MLSLLNGSTLTSGITFTTGITIALTIWTFVGRVISLLFYTLSKLVIALLPRSKHLLLLWLQSPCTDFGIQENEVCHCFHSSPSLCHEVMGLDAMILVFCMFSFKPGKSHKGSLSRASEVVSRKMSSEGLHVKCPRQCLLFTAQVCTCNCFSAGRWMDGQGFLAGVKD